MKIAYVRTGGGRGGPDQCVRTAYRGGGGVKNWQIFAYVLYGWPLSMERIRRKLREEIHFEEKCTSYLTNYLTNTEWWYNPKLLCNLWLKTSRNAYIL